MIARKGDFISLKEAAEISGYSADYVGQLIRNGKLPGKQVFANVAWMTTEQAIRDYMGGKRTKAAAPDALERIERLIESPRVVKILAGSLIVVSIAFTLLLFYVFSTALDQSMSDRAAERLETAQEL